MVSVMPLNLGGSWSLGRKRGDQESGVVSIRLPFSCPDPINLSPVSFVKEAIFNEGSWLNV